MLRRVWAALGRGPARGIAGSVAIHALVVALLLFFAASPSRISVKRGEPLFVELPELPEPAPKGNPAARAPGPPDDEVARPAPPRPKAPEAPAVAAKPAPRPASPPVAQPPRPAQPETPPAVASRQQQAPPPAPVSPP